MARRKKRSPAAQANRKKQNILDRIPFHSRRVLIEALYPEARYNGMNRGNHRYRIGSIDGEPGNSCLIDSSGWMYDYNGGKTNDIVDCVMHVHDLDHSGALKWLSDNHFLDGMNEAGEHWARNKAQFRSRDMANARKVQTKLSEDWTHAPVGVKPPTKAMILRTAEKLKFNITEPKIAVYPYYHHGQIVMLQVRIDALGEGKKYFLRYTWAGAGWKAGGTDGMLMPLFGIERIDPEIDTYLIVEGEKTQRAAINRFPDFNVLSCAVNSAQYSDFRPLIERASKVYILPDYDAAGTENAFAVENYLKGESQLAQKELEIIFLHPGEVARDFGINDKLPQGWDIADIPEDAPIQTWVDSGRKQSRKKTELSSSPTLRLADLLVAAMPDAVYNEKDGSWSVSPSERTTELMCCIGAEHMYFYADPSPALKQLITGCDGMDCHPDDIRSTLYVRAFGAEWERLAFPKQ